MTNARGIHLVNDFLAVYGSDFVLGFNDGRAGSDGKQHKRALVHGGHPHTKDQLLVNFYNGLTGHPDFKDGVVISGPVNILTNTTPNVAVLSAIDPHGNVVNLTLTGPVTINGTLTVNGDLAITGGLSVGGTLTVGNLVVTGAATMNGPTTLNGTVTANLPTENPAEPTKAVLIKTDNNQLVRDV